MKIEDSAVGRAVEFANSQEPHPLNSALYVAVLAVAMERLQWMLSDVEAREAPTEAATEEVDAAAEAAAEAEEAAEVAEVAAEVAAEAADK